MTAKRYFISIVLCAAVSISAQAQNESWFDENGKILSKYLDDETGLLADEFLADAYEFTSIEEAMKAPSQVIKLNLSSQNISKIPEGLYIFVIKFCKK